MLEASRYQPWKLANVAQEITRMNVDVLGVAVTFWDGVGDHITTLPNTGKGFRVIHSRGDVKRRGVAPIIEGMAKSATRECDTVSVAREQPSDTEDGT